MMITIHQVQFTSKAKVSTCVKVKCGDMVVTTDMNEGGSYHQAVSLFVEQGSSVIDFDLLDNRKRVLAQLRLDIMKDIFRDGEPVSVTEKVFVMKQKQKQILSPKITLTFSPEQVGDEEKALLTGINASAETEWMLAQHLRRVDEQQQDITEGKGQVAEQLSEIQLLAKGCCGPLERFQKLGKTDRVYVGVVGPPMKKRFSFHIWKSEQEYKDEQAAIAEIDLLRITSVSQDPSRPEGFAISYVGDSKERTHIKFNRVDRSRDVWVEMLQLLVAKVHADREGKKKGKSQK